MSSPGMPIKQVIAMLMAAEAQGATAVHIGRRLDHGVGLETGIDWVSPAPVNGVAYLGCMSEWDDMGNEALESLDW